jgi:signal transduction histidine kinase
VRGGVEVKVSDEGCGIAKEDIPRIFEQFKRGSNATKYKPVGNGLGLYIVKRIIKRSRGKIRVESSIDHGTTFTIFLPQA